MEKHNRYGEHVNKKDLKELWETCGEIMGNENEIICPHCGLIIDPKTVERITKSSETPQSTTVDQETGECSGLSIDTGEHFGLFIDTGMECPECKEKYVLLSCIDHTYYYTTPADLQSLLSIWSEK